jgi:acyl carrier protein
VTGAEAREVIDRALEEVAPEVDASALDPEVPLHDQVDLDSMDFLSLVATVHELSGVDIPEADYPRMATLASGAEYLAERTASGPSS